MQTKCTLPPAVINLRRVWESKKIEMRFNQTGAAKELGWSQGAISHYLNNITELGPTAIVKFANFLDVDPTEIDPTIVSKLPHVRKLNITKRSGNLTQPFKSAVYDRDDIEHIYVQIDKNITIEGTNKLVLPTPQLAELAPAVLKLCKQSKFSSNSLVAVRLKAEKHLRLYRKTSAPHSDKIHTLWAVMSISYF
jgi:transcriptional regulator with XRE-family HTH domain